MIFKRVGIVSGARTAIGCINGMFKHLPSPLILSQILVPALSQTPVALVSQAIFSSCLQANLGICPVKQAMSLAGFPNIPSFAINNGHSGGLKAVVLASQAIELGSKVVLCGGFDSASLAPHSLQGRSGWRASTVTDELPIAYFSSNGLHYGLTIEEINAKFNVSRSEQEDFSRYAFDRRLVCIKTKYFEKEIRGEAKNDELGFYPEYKSINPLFYSAGSVTSLTTALPSDGAVALQVADKEVIRKFQLDCLADVVAFVHERGHPVLFPSILPKSIKKLLDCAGIHKSMIGLWEVNDFFSTIPSVVCKVLEIPMKIVNVTGGNMSVGDILGGSSAKSVLSCCLAMKERQEEYGVVISSNCDGEVVAVLLRNSSFTNKESSA